MKSSELPLGENALITDTGALMVFLRRCDDDTIRVIINNNKDRSEGIWKNSEGILNHLWDPKEKTFTKIDYGEREVYLWGGVGKEQFASLDIKRNRFEWLNKDGELEVLDLDHY